MSRSAEPLERYGRKCLQQLSRVRLSHCYAISGLKNNPCDGDYQSALLGPPFDSDAGDLYEEKLGERLHKIHFVALKTNFEFYLNRVATTLFGDRINVLIETISKAKKINPQQLAESTFAQDLREAESAYEAFADAIVSNKASRKLLQMLKEATGIDLQRILDDQNLWPQISVALRIRDLVEHRNGLIDKRFREDVKRSWPLSSWGRPRRTRLDQLKRVPIDEDDVSETYKAMYQAVELITAELLKWDASQTA